LHFKKGERAAHEETLTAEKQAAKALQLSASAE
jgi:hypothetical protein